MQAKEKQAIVHTLGQVQANTKAFAAYAARMSEYIAGFEAQLAQLTKPFHRRLRCEMEARIQWFRRLRDQYQSLANPVEAYQKMEPYVLEVAALHEQQLEEQARSTDTPRTTASSIPRHATDATGQRAAADGEAPPPVEGDVMPDVAPDKFTLIARDKLSFDVIVDDLGKDFALRPSQVFVKMEEVCQRCNVNKEEIPGEGIIWCPSCLDSQRFMSSTTGAEFTQRKDSTNSRYTRLEQLIKELKYAQFKEPYRVPQSVIDKVAEYTYSLGYTDPERIDIVTMNHIVRSMRKKCKDDKLDEEDDDEGEEDEEEPAGNDAASVVSEEDFVLSGSKHAAKPPTHKHRSDDVSGAAVDTSQMRKYYPFMTQIHVRVTGNPPLELTQHEERVIILVFLALQEVFPLFKQKRVNMLKYKYILHRECQALAEPTGSGKRALCPGLDRALPYFPLLKCEDTQHEHDATYSLMASQIGLPVILRHDDVPGPNPPNVSIKAPRTTVPLFVPRHNDAGREAEKEDNPLLNQQATSTSNRKSSPPQSAKRPRGHGRRDDDQQQQHKRHKKHVALA